MSIVLAIVGMALSFCGFLLYKCKWLAVWLAGLGVLAVIVALCVEMLAQIGLITR